jgi:transcriptional regulator with XRE-family HTH domain
MTIGNELRDARERLGLSREHISVATKIPVSKVTALEDDGFDRLPSGIYLDGFVAAYAREVGLDAEAMVRRLRAQLAPPPPETLEQIATARQFSQAPALELQFSLAHGMFAFAGVAVVLAILGIAVHLFPRQPAPELARRVAPARGTIARSAIAQEIVEPLAPVELLARPIPEPMPFAAVSNLAGAWTLETQVTSSSLRTFEGLRLGYRLELTQDGGRIDGRGRKISENGVALRGRRQTPIVVQGTIDGGRLRLTFGEQGARRHSTGTFALVLEDAGVLRGSFASGAARSAGIVAARRL